MKEFLKVKCTFESHLRRQLRWRFELKNVCRFKQSLLCYGSCLTGLNCVPNCYNLIINKWLSKYKANN